MFGRVIGGFIGLSISQDIFGALAGFMVGLVIDSYFENIEKPLRINDKWQTEFSYYFILLHAKFAKIDGQVTPIEVRTFQDMISVSSADNEAVRALYNMHRKSSDGFEHVAVRLSEMLLLKEDLRRMVIESLCVVGMIDSNLNLYQGAFIQAVGRILALSDKNIDAIKLKVQHDLDAYSSDEAYKDRSKPNTKIWNDMSSLKILGVKKTATKEEVRKAYKKAIRANHPDKLRGEGASEKKIKVAEEKLTKINAAYAKLTGK